MNYLDCAKLLKIYCTCISLVFFLVLAGNTSKIEMSFNIFYTEVINIYIIFLFFVFFVVVAGNG